MDKVIEELELQLQIAFMTGTTMVHIEKNKAMFILDRLKEARDKWYEEGENQ